MSPLPAARSGWSLSCPLWLLCLQVGGLPSSGTLGSCAWAGVGVGHQGGQGGVGQGRGSQGLTGAPLSSAQLPACPGHPTVPWASVPHPLLQALWSESSGGTRSSARTSWTPYSPTLMLGPLRLVHAVSAGRAPQPSWGGRAGSKPGLPGGWMNEGSYGHLLRDWWAGHSLQGEGLGRRYH